MFEIYFVLQHYMGTARGWVFGKKSHPRQDEKLHDAARECERRVLEHTGLNMQEVHTIDVIISEDNQSQRVNSSAQIENKNGAEIVQNHSKEWVHMIQSGETTKPAIVLVHGFAASSLSYYKMISPLTEKFNVYAIDLPGMGLSSKQVHWKVSDSPQPALDYFLDSIEKWRIAVGLDNFTLVGHSLGGYISAHYALQHPERVKTLILLSCAGVTKISEKDIQDHYSATSFLQKVGLKIFAYLWDNQVTFNQIYRDGKFFPVEWAMKMYMKMLDLPQEECESWTLYMDKLLSLPVRSEKSVFELLQYPKCNAHMPLEEILPEQIKMPVHFCYGGKEDWMCNTGAKKMAENSKTRDPQKSLITFKSFENFNHQFPFFNPEETAKFILDL